MVARKSIVVALTIGLVAGAFAGLPAEAKKKKKKPKRTERTVESQYEAPAIGSGIGICFGVTNSCGNIPPGAGEKYVKIEIDDNAGMPVYFSVGQDTDPDTPGTEGDLGDHCGKMEEFVAIEEGFEIVVFPWLLGRPNCPGIATQGTVIATFSNLP